MIAAAAMALSSLSVVTNANRLRRWRMAPLPIAAAPVAVEPLVETPRIGTPQVTDPVCGMSLDPTAAERRSTPIGSYFFCSAHCAAAFDAEPERYTTTEEGGQHAEGEHR